MPELDRLHDASRVPRVELAALGPLDEGHYAVLRTAFEHARDKRERELSAAIDKGLTVVPPLARAMVRRILFS
ncbi:MULTISPECIES: hypothetical protein [unclassified Nocardia]|uniref:hypothetical protein n=1 Tax=unclassified Nocardia TaxID=2637762 RepID=UPI0035D6EB7D